MTHSLLSKALDATSFLPDSAHTVGMFEFLPVLEWNLEFQSPRQLQVGTKDSNTKQRPVPIVEYSAAPVTRRWSFKHTASDADLFQRSPVVKIHQFTDDKISHCQVHLTSTFFRILCVE